MIVSAISVVVSSRLVASCTTPSLSSTMASSFGVATGRFSQAFNSPCKIFWRSNRSRRQSFLITMYGISSIRSYVVNRRSHFRHSRRRRMVSPVRPSRESITLSSRCPQKGHFTPAFLLRRPLPHFRARQSHPTLLCRAQPSLSIAQAKRPRELTVVSPQSRIRQTSLATAPSPPQTLGSSPLRRSRDTRIWLRPGALLRPRATEKSIQPGSAPAAEFNPQVLTLPNARRNSAVHNNRPLKLTPSAPRNRQSFVLNLSKTAVLECRATRSK